MKYAMLLLLTGLFFATSADAATYEWIDEKGVVNFTDNPDNIPPKYKDKAKKRFSVEPDSAKGAPVQPQKPDQPPRAAEPSPQAEAPVLYGGHDEAWWRSSFNGIRNEIKGIEAALPAKKEDLAVARRKLTIYQYTQYRVAYHDLLVEIEKDEARIQELTKQLQALDVSASRAGVPFDWRQ